MLNRIKRKQQVAFHDFVESHFQDFVEVNTYISHSKLYGVISNYDAVSLTLTINYVDEEHPKYKKTESLYIPLNSIKYIRKL